MRNAEPYGRRSPRHGSGRCRDAPRADRIVGTFRGLAAGRAARGILLLLIVPPTIFLVDTSFHTTNPDGSFGQFTLKYYRELFTSPYFA